MVISQESETLFISDMKKAYESRVHGDIFSVNMVITIEVAHHLTHLEVFPILLGLLLLFRCVMSLSLVRRFAQETLLHALSVLYLRVYKSP